MQEQNKKPENLGPDQLIGVIVISKMSEFFGLFTFAIASALVFPHVIFPNFEPLTGTLLSFGVFSLMFIARPFARIFSRRLDHRVGRAAKITLAMFLLGGSTMAIGFVPSYQEIGVIAPILLCLARLGQGLGVGGIWDGLPVIMMLEAPEKRRSWYAMIPQLGAPLGFLISASIFFVLVKFLSPEEFLSWGWRFPFFVVLSLQVVALFARLRLIATPEYNHALESHHLRGALIRDVIRHQFMQVALGAYLPLAAYALFHMVAVFPLAYISLYQDLPIPTLLMMQMVGATIAVFTCILSGPLADRFGRRRFLMVIAVLIGLLSFNIVDLLDRAWVYVLLGFSLLGLSFGQSGGTLPHRFKPEYRFTGVSLTTDMAWLFGAAFAPIISLSLTEWLGIEYAGYYLLSGALATLASLYVVHRLSNRSR